MSKLLLDERPLIILPQLAIEIGLNEAIFIQQIHYLLQISKNEINGSTWAYNTYEQLHEMFPFFAIRTIKNIVKNLKKQGILRVENLSTDKRDKTNWYSIDYEEFEKKKQKNDHRAEFARPKKDDPPSCKSCTMDSAENVVMDSADLAPCIIVSKTTTETTTNNEEKRREDFNNFRKEFIEIYSKEHFYVDGFGFNNVPLIINLDGLILNANNFRFLPTKTAHKIWEHLYKNKNSEILEKIS